MIRGCLVCAAVVMLLAPAALAEVGMAQGYTLYVPNVVFRSGPQSSATGGNTVTVQQNQWATDVLGTVATQLQTGTLNQDAAATGQSDGSQTSQQAQVGGLQDQGVADAPGYLPGVVVGLPTGLTMKRPIVGWSISELLVSVLNR